MNDPIVLFYDKRQIPVTVGPALAAKKSIASIRFVLLGNTYTLAPTAWEPDLLHALETVFKIHYKMQNVTHSQLITESALDIVRAIMHIYYAYGNNCLSYAIYHLKNYPNETGASYDDFIMEAACQAMIDVDFMMPPSMVYDRVTLANEGRNLHVSWVTNGNRVPIDSQQK